MFADHVVLHGVVNGSCGSIEQQMHYGIWIVVNIKC
jgi:hypothetical protein